MNVKTNKPLRLIVWGTGLVGTAVLRELIHNPCHQIVAVIVNATEKHNKDIGELTGSAPIGIIATNNIAEALAQPADALAYFGPSALYADINMANLSRALRCGLNVVDTSMGVFENPDRAPAQLRDQIEQACNEGGSSFFSAGIDPGFGNDLMPITLLGVCAKVDKVRTIEFIDAGSYPDQESLIQMGLTSGPQTDCVLDMPGIMTAVWGGPLYMIAQALGVEIERTEENYQRWFTQEAVEYERGSVDAGHCAAHQIQLRGIVNGKPKIIIDHIHRLFPDAAPDWQRPQTHHSHANRIEIDGSPQIRQETVIENAVNGDGNQGTCLATGMRAINAIPSVCAASPGIVSTLDLPLIAGIGTMR